MVVSVANDGGVINPKQCHTFVYFKYNYCMPASFDSVRKKLNLKDTLRRVKDSRNFTVDKTTRFAGRFFQIALALFAWYFLASQNGNIAAYYELTDIIYAMWFFAVVSPIVSTFLVVLYVAPWFSHSWSSKRILILEIVADFLMAFGWLSGFIVMMVATKGHCVPLPDTSCTNFNWLEAWCFLSFAAFLYGLAIDIITLYKGVCGSSDIEAEILLDVRRTTRMK